MWLALPGIGHAVESVRVDLETKAIDLAPMVERYTPMATKSASPPRPAATASSAASP